MTKIDLITGFLGSGKTTFIRHYARYLLGQGLRIAILENDYGGVNVDRMLLEDLESDRCELEMVVGGSRDCCTHQRRLRTKLISLAMQGFDRVVMEPSGVYDADEFFDVLCEPPLDQWYEAGSVIAVVDAGMAGGAQEDLTEETRYLLFSQCAPAGLIAFSRVQMTPPERTLRTEQMLRGILRTFGRQDGPEKKFLRKNWEELEDADFRDIMTCGYAHADYVKHHVDDRGGFGSVFILNPPDGREGLAKKTEELFADRRYGRVLRVKGYIPNEAGAAHGGKAWLSLNAVPGSLVFTESETGQAVVVVIGENLQEDAVRALMLS